MAQDGEELVIRTSQPGWFRQLADVYKKRVPATVVDDAKVGVDLSVQSLLDIGRQAGLSQREWLAVLISLGLSAAGAAMIYAAIFDPEPTSKLALLVAGGTLCLFGGGFSALRVLTNHRPPSVTVGRNGIKVDWD